MPGLRWVFWPISRVEKHPWVQVPAGEIGVVIAQIGKPLPVGAKSARYNPLFGNFTDIGVFLENGGEKGVQRPVLPPGTLAPIHPVAFLVLTKDRVYGIPISPELQIKEGEITPETFGLKREQLNVVRIEPEPGRNGEVLDMIGIVTTFEGNPLPPGTIATRIGDFEDISEDIEDNVIIERVLGTKNEIHNNYQDFQKFLDSGGKIGLQHDPLLYGAFNLNPFLVSVEKLPMLIVKQGEVAVIKSYVGKPTKDISGAEFKFGTLVRPGYRGIWNEPLRTGKYPINPRCYEAIIVPTSILTLNWATITSKAHELDKELNPIDAKSREGFEFKIDLQVQIHIPDTKAPRVISIVGSIQNLVNEVLQGAVGNHFRDKLQGMPAIKFIETRQQVQEEAFLHIKNLLSQYDVETKGVFIQDVILPHQLVNVLTDREIANQEIETYKKQKEAQEERIVMEKTKGTADQQAELARSQVGIEIKSNNARARKAEADGEASYIRETGFAKGAEVEAIGMARAKAYQGQVEALGKTETALVNAIVALAEAKARIAPETLVLTTGGSGSLEGLAASLMNYLAKIGKKESS
ncbi:MAG: SPFH domain-containing protein [bacterium]